MPHKAVYNFGNSWATGLQGRLDIYVGKDIIGGWTAELKFTSALTSLDLYNAVVAKTSADNKVFTLANTAINADLWNGQQIGVDFVANFDSAAAPMVMTAFFEGIQASGTLGL